MKYINFESKYAQLYGIESAIVLQNIMYWLEHNKANKKNFNDGRYWTFNSMKAFQTMFPFMSVGIIRRAIDNLVKNDVLLTGNYNDTKYDRTTWYSLTDNFMLVHMPEMTNGSVENDEPIPCIYHVNNNDSLDNKTNDIYTESTPLESINANAGSDAQLYIGTKPKKVKVERTKKDKQADIINNYTKDDSVKDALYRYIRSRKESGRYMSTEALTLLLRQLDEVDNKVASIEQSILKNYTAFYKVVTHGTDNKYSKEYRDVVDRYGAVQLPPHLQNINNEDD